MRSLVLRFSELRAKLLVSGVGEVAADRAPMVELGAPPPVAGAADATALGFEGVETHRAAPRCTVARRHRLHPVVAARVLGQEGNACAGLVKIGLRSGLPRADCGRTM